MACIRSTDPRIHTRVRYMHPLRTKAPTAARVNAPTRVYAPLPAYTSIRNLPAYTHPPPRTSTYAYTRRRVRKRTPICVYAPDAAYTRGRDERHGTPVSEPRTTNTSHLALASHADVGPSSIVVHSPIRGSRRPPARPPVSRAHISIQPSRCPGEALWRCVVATLWRRVFTPRS
jgi:hypothetical protein